MESTETTPKTTGRLVSFVKIFTVLVFFAGASAYVAVASKPDNDQSHAFHVLMDGGQSGSWEPKSDTTHQG